MNTTTTTKLSSKAIRAQIEAERGPRPDKAADKAGYIAWNKAFRKARGAAKKAGTYDWGSRTPGSPKSSKTPAVMFNGFPFTARDAERVYNICAKNTNDAGATVVFFSAFTLSKEAREAMESHGYEITKDGAIKAPPPPKTKEEKEAEAKEAKKQKLLADLAALGVEVPTVKPVEPPAPPAAEPEPPAKSETVMKPSKAERRAARKAGNK